MGLKSFVVLALVAATATPALAGSCGYTYCWGAVGIGPGGAYGWSVGQRSEGNAISEAQSGCEGDCTNIRTFYNTCGAMAEAPDGAWGFGWNADMRTAKSLALGYCAENGYDCQLRAWACSK
ncbi:MAG: DUF4189 domain-containing protein [Paracoccaceae bacterium]